MRKLPLLTMLMLLLTLAVGTTTAQANRSIFERGHNSTWFAIESVSRATGISAKRLHYRVSVEGGHGAWIMNSRGSDAGGPFQFMPGTYRSYSSNAFKWIWSKGYKVPWKYNSWYSKLGQTITAAYMFHLGLECARVGWAASC